MRKRNERGAIVVEAVLSLTAFVFMLFTLLSLVDIYFIQAKIGVSLNSAAKEISQYSYLYYKLGVDEFNKNISSGTEDYAKSAQNTIDGMGTLMDAFGKGKANLAEGSIDGMMDQVNRGQKTVDSLITEYKDLIGDDPKGFIMGMGKMAASELTEEGKVWLGKMLAKSFMQKNLKATVNDDANAFLLRHRVIDGMDGLDFNYTTLMAYGTSDKIQLCVTYDVQVIKLLNNIDFSFTFRQVAQTKAWDTGISLIAPKKETMSTSPEDSPWNKPDKERADDIIAREKEKYLYTSNRNFHAYTNSGGKNEFVFVKSIDTFGTSYQKENGITRELSGILSKLDTDVTAAAQDDKVTVDKRTGSNTSEKATLESPATTRTYKIVLVVPANTPDMDFVKKEVDAFLSKEWPDDMPPYTVEISTAYGSKPLESEASAEDKDTDAA